MISTVRRGSSTRWLGGLLGFWMPAVDRDELVGFGAGRGYEFDEFFADAASVGLRCELSLSSWDLRPFDSASTFLVAVLAVA